MSEYLPEKLEGSEKVSDELIKNSLLTQLEKMRERKSGRSDIKFKILKQFVSDLEKQPFEEAFANLNETQKHAIITRLENEAEHIGGSIPYNFIKKLEQKLYGVILDEEGEVINFKKKEELERQLQLENKNLYTQ